MQPSPTSQPLSNRQLRYLFDGFTVLRRKLFEQPPSETMAAAIAEVAVSTLGFADWASVTEMRDGALTTTGCTDERARRADALQYVDGSGPCVEAVSGNPELLIVDMAEEQRWPSFTQRAAEEFGVVGMLSLSWMLDESHIVGGLNLYCRSAGALTEQALPAAQLLAAYGTLAMVSQNARRIT